MGLDEKFCDVLLEKVDIHVLAGSVDWSMYNLLNNHLKSWLNLERRASNILIRMTKYWPNW